MSALGSCRYRAVFGFLPVLALVACGGEGTVDPPPPPPPALTVAVSPGTATVPAGGSQSFSATVANATNPAVTWTSSAGTITGTGSTITWNAPATGGSHTVTATSVQDASKSNAATVTVTAAAVAIAPAEAALFRGEPQSFTATVTGVAAGETGVTWSASCGEAEAEGATLGYTAPDLPGTCIITATSALDPTRSATATVTVRPEWLVGATDDVADPAGCTWNHCSMREALEAAQTVDGPGVILLGSTAVVPGTAGAVRSAPSLAAAQLTGTITLTSPLPAITTPISIHGPGAAQLTIDANASVASQRRIFTISGNVAVAVSGLTLTRGRSNGGGAISVGGGAEVTLTDLVLTRNETSVGSGGGLIVFGQSTARLENVAVEENRTLSTDAAGGPGGGIRVVEGSTFEMIGGRIRGSEVTIGWGGGISVFSSHGTLTGVAVENNITTGNSGGGIIADGTATLVVQDGAITGNRADWGGGLSLNGAQVNATVTNTTIGQNTAVTSQGGGVYINAATANFTDVTVVGNRTIVPGSSGPGGGLRVVANATLQMTGGAIRGNSVANGWGGGIGVFNSQATLTGVAIEDNTAIGSGGGGLLADGTAVVTIQNGIVAGNRGNFGGGLAFSGANVTGSIVNTVIAGNTATDQLGGGIYSANARLTITDSEIRENTAQVQAGGVYVSNSPELTIRGGSVSNNTASLYGGMWINVSTSVLENLEIVGNASGATGIVGGLAISGTGTLTGLTIRDNQAAGFGGGLAVSAGGDVTASGLVITGNSSGSYGGGVYVQGNGILRLSRSTVAGNSATTLGGGLAVLGGQQTVQLDQILVEGNTSEGMGGGLFWGASVGGGVGQFTVRNSTVSGNTAVDGGGVAVAGNASLTNLTVVGNSASARGGGVYSSQGAGTTASGVGTLTVTNLLLSGNQADGAATNCGTSGTGAIASDGNNLSDDATCATLTQPGDRPASTAAGVAAELEDNGGPTRTHALLEGSAAINAGKASACAATDQRGYGRKGACDIGAFEFDGVAPSAVRAAGAPARRAPASPR